MKYKFEFEEHHLYLFEPMCLQDDDTSFLAQVERKQRLTFLAGNTPLPLLASPSCTTSDNISFVSVFSIFSPPPPTQPTTTASTFQERCANLITKGPPSPLPPPAKKDLSPHRRPHPHLSPPFSMHVVLVCLPPPPPSLGPSRSLSWHGLCTNLGLPHTCCW